MDLDKHKGFKFLILDKKDTRERIGLPPYPKLHNPMYMLKHQFYVDFILYVFDTDVHNPLKDSWRAWSAGAGFFTFGDPEVIPDEPMDDIFNRVILVGKLKEKR
jgi:hypothetical protein